MEGKITLSDLGNELEQYEKEIEDVSKIPDTHICGFIQVAII